MKMEALQLYKCPKLGPALCSLTHASHSDNLFYSFMGALHAGSEGFAVLWVPPMQVQRALQFYGRPPCRFRGLCSFVGDLHADTESRMGDIFRLDSIECWRGNYQVSSFVE